MFPPPSASAPCEVKPAGPLRQQQVSVASQTAIIQQNNKCKKEK